jgi:hypothetical protein
MDQTEKKRKLLLGVALVVTLIAVVLVEEEESMIDTVEPIQPARPSVERANIQENNSAYLDVSKLERRKFNPLAGELFVSTTWAPRQPQINLQQQAQQAAAIAQQAKEPPPAPTPPPLQFKYIGKAIDGNKTWVFLTQAGENHITRIGEKIDAQYRLDAINDETVMFTYLPLGAKQTLAINSNAAGNIR